MSFGIALTKEKKTKRILYETEFRILLFAFIFFAGLIFASSAYAATEFVSVIDPGNGAGTDFTSLSAWESSTQVDLTSAATKVFSISSASGTFAVGGNLTGETSLATASSTYRTATQVLIYNVSGAFQSGETVYVTGQATSSNYVILSNTGDSAIAVASARCTQSGGVCTADTTAVTIDGWTTSATNYIKSWTDPTTGARHNGKWDDGKYRLSNEIWTLEDYIWIDALQIGFSATGNNAGIDIYSTGASSEIKLSNNIIKAISVSGDYNRGIRVEDGVEVKIWNNIVYGFNGANDYGISVDGYDSTIAYIYNNTVVDTNIGISEYVGNTVYVKNNTVQDSTTADYYSASDWGAGSDYNISDDNTAPGANSKNLTTVSFVDSTNNDFHLSPSDTAARNAGTSTILWDANLSFTQDIDGSYRGNAWDIGADEVPTELVSTICESVSAGGDCANRDYVTLSAWEAAVDSNLTASSTRVFSGTASGTLASAASVTLYDAGGASTGITGTINATTTNQIMIINILGTSSPVSVASGTSWRINSSNTWRLAGTADQLGASPIAVAKIDGAWTTADTGITINGWTTSQDNYIKVYTATAARHSGKLKNDAYFINGIIVSDKNTWVDGLQFNNASLQAASIASCNGGKISFSNNIIKESIMAATNQASDCNLYIWNNLIYDNNSSYASMYLYANRAYVYNNTISNSVQSSGIRSISGTVVAKNNLVVNTANPFEGTFATGTDYNATDVNDTPGVGSNNLVNQTFSFVDEANKDFHLAPTDTAAKGAGTNLYNDANINVVSDIDGASRPVSASIGIPFDIGADQTAVKIYRSIAPSATAALTTGASNAVTVSSSTSLATFATALADNIGVGDVIIYNTGGSATSTAFIHGRSSSTVYTVKTASGTLPTAVSADTTWSIYRAYTSLSNAEEGTENTGIANPAIRNFDAWSGGADLVASNTQWNIAAYANGTTEDTINVTISGWTTGAQNYIKVYTPTETNEVGTSQRHQGKWDDGKYRLVITTDSTGITVNEDFVRIDGLQISISPTSNGRRGISLYTIGEGGELWVSNSIVKASFSGTSNSNAGILLYGSATNKTGKIWNNIVYDIINPAYTSDIGINIGTGWTAYVYNNTVYNSYIGLIRSAGTFIAKNNISYNNTDNYWGTFDSSSTNNLSGPTQSDAPGSNPVNAATVSFVDETNDDFHLSPSDTAALDAGTSTPATDSNLSFTDDIDGHTRRQWDIGADEASVEYVTSVMQSGGNFSTLSSWEAANQVDLATTSTAVFSLSSASGTIPASASVMGFTSGAVASTTVGSVSTSTQILLFNIASSTFQSGERIYIRGAATTSNYAILGNVGNPVIAVAKIDGAWTSADTTAVTIDGWTTGPNNYIKIYTTAAARHNGKWDDAKYRLVNNSTLIYLNEDYVRVEGLQLYHTNTANSYSYGIRMDTVSAVNDIRISYNIIRGGNTPATLRERYTGISIFNTNAVVRVWNNIIYDWASSGNPTGTGGINSAYSTTVYAYNNTLYNNRIGLRRNTGTVIAKNNIANGNTEDYAGSFDASSANNISSDVTSPNSGGTDCGGHSCRNQTVSFVDSANGDFHLAPTDTVAKDNGTSTAADPYLPFSTDIDGQYRGSSATSSAGGLGWDIGADEGATIMYRSIGNDTGNLDTGGATVTVASSTATFSAGLPNNIGVGDVIQYGNPLTLAFITGRSSSTAYSIANATGTYPIATTSAAAAIYRAHRYLDDWEDQVVGDVNASIDSGLRSLVLVSTDLVASNTAVFVPAYASSSPDTLAVDINGWTTGAQNYIKVYTPVNSNEVGTSQRHQGKWDSAKYQLVTTSSTNLDYSLTISESFTRVEGLQVSTAPNSQTRSGAIHVYSGSVSYARIESSILRQVGSGTYCSSGVQVWQNGANVDIINSIAYGFTDSGDDCTAGFANWGSGTLRCYNCTSVGSYYAYKRGSGAVELINSIGADFLTAFSHGTVSVTYSASSGSLPAGTGNRSSQTFSFVDAANADFHLAPTDRAARDAGISLANDAYLPFAVDIDGGARPQGPAWDIGADEATPVPDYRFRGDFKFRGIFKFR